jgi:hypothetical protein
MAAPIELGWGASNAPSAQEAGSYMALKAVKRTMTEILRDWHDFYVLMGTMAATLVGLMFVAASIGAGLFTDEHKE